MKKSKAILTIVAVAILALCLMAGGAKADLLAEYLFDADYSDTSGNGYDGIPDGDAQVVDGKLELTGGAYMDLPASFGTVNPFDGSGDFTIEMDFMASAGDSILMSSSRDDTPANHSMAVYTSTGWRSVEIDNFYVGWAGTDKDGFPDSEWHSLRVAYDHSQPMMEVTILGEEGWSSSPGYWNPDVPDIHLDTVSLGRSLNAEYPYEVLSDPAGWAIELDNVRIYNHYIPEPATMLLLGLGGLALLRKIR